MFYIKHKVFKQFEDNVLHFEQIPFIRTSEMIRFVSEVLTIANKMRRYI